jgi:hypothetical protein
LVGRTEKQKNNHDPFFTAKVTFRVRANDSVRLALLEVEDDTRLDENGLVGEAFVTGASLVDAKSQTLRLTKDGKTAGDTAIIINPSPTIIADMEAKVMQVVTSFVCFSFIVLINSRRRQRKSPPQLKQRRLQQVYNMCSKQLFGIDFLLHIHLRHRSTQHSWRFCRLCVGWIWIVASPFYHVVALLLHSLIS